MKGRHRYAGYALKFANNVAMSAASMSLYIVKNVRKHAKAVLKNAVKWLPDNILEYSYLVVFDL